MELLAYSEDRNMKAYSFAQWLYIFSIQTFDCLLLVSYYRFIYLIHLPAMISLVYPRKKIRRCCLFSQTVDHSLNCLHWDLLRGFIYAREISPNLMCESPQKTIKTLCLVILSVEMSTYQCQRKQQKLSLSHLKLTALYMILRKMRQKILQGF